jgi:extracellular elastinolytic metalloproteinase
MKNRFLIKITLTLFPLLLIAALSYSQPNQKLISNHLAKEREKNNWLHGDISDWIITDQYTDKATGITHTYIQQRHHHIVVYNAISVFALKENNVIHFKPGLISQLEKKVNTDQPSVTPKTAIDFALRHLGKNEKEEIKLISTDTTLNRYIFDAPATSYNPIKVQLVYRATENNSVRLAWEVSLDVKGDSHWWNVRVDAVTGAFIDKNDFTAQ